MKSPQIIQQLKKYQSRRRNQFLLHSRHAEKKYSHVDRHQSSEGSGFIMKKPTNVSDGDCAVLNDSNAITNTVQSVTDTATVTAMSNNSVTDTNHSAANGIWSRSDSAFTSFTNVSNSQNT